MVNGARYNYILIKLHSSPCIGVCLAGEISGSVRIWVKRRITIIFAELKFTAGAMLLILTLGRNHPSICQNSVVECLSFL